MSAARVAAVGGGTAIGFLAAGPAGALVGAVLGVLVTAGGAKASPAMPPKEEPVKEEPVKEEPGKTVPARARIIADGEYPSTFAAKYGGSAAKWTELPASNPGMHIVYNCKHTGEDGGTRTEWYTSCVAPDEIVDKGLSPWSVGQSVQLPDSWPG